MSIWQFNSAILGYIKANTQKNDKSFSSEKEKDSIFDFAVSSLEIKKKERLGIMYLWDGKNFTVHRQIIFEV